MNDIWLSTKDNPPKKNTIVKIKADNGKEYYAILTRAAYYIFDIYSGHWTKSNMDTEKEWLYSVIDTNHSHIYPYYAIANSRKSEII